MYNLIVAKIFLMAVAKCTVPLNPESTEGP